MQPTMIPSPAASAASRRARASVKPPVLTEALALRDAALAAGFGIMVGCMVATSLAMAPAVLVAQGAAVTDLDGPLLLARDRAPGLTYDDRGVHPATPELWG